MKCRKCLEEFNNSELKSNSGKCRECKVIKKPGHIYIITNQAWVGWCKIGMTTTSPEDRLKAYRPFRDYRIEYSEYSDNVSLSKIHIHTHLRDKLYVNNSEWFKLPVDEAKRIISKLIL